MRIRKPFLLPTLAVVLAGGNGLMAQVTTGSLNGKLTDASGKPIAKARVSLESSALFAPRTLITNADGEYRAQLLPVGNYNVRVSADGMVGKTASNVRVGVGSSLTLSFTLKPAATLNQTVEVYADMAQESKTDDKVSTNYSAEKLLQLPSDGGPSFAGALNATPGVTGVSEGLQNAKIRGSASNNVMFRVDGINVKDDSGSDQVGSGMGALYQPMPDSIEDVQVILTALSARYGSVAGGQVNVVTKSGSNSFEGTIRSTFSRNSWAADLPLAGGSYNAAQRSEKFNHFTDITFSGPIVQDRLWFYLGTRIQPSQEKTRQLAYSTTGLELTSDGLATGNQIPWDTVKNELIPQTTMGLIPAVDGILAAGPGGSYRVNVQEAGKYVHGNTDFKKYEGKLTGALNDAHILSFTYLYEKTGEGASTGERDSGNLVTATNASQVGTITTKTTGWTLNWNGTLAPNWTIEARVSHTLRTQGDVPRPAGYESGASVWETYQSPSPLLMLHDDTGGSGNNYYYGSVTDPHYMSTFNTPEKRGSEGYSVNVTTFQDLLGQHQIDFGGERSGTIYNFGRNRPGHTAFWVGGAYMNSNGQMLYPVYSRMANADGTMPDIRSPWGHAEGSVEDPGTPWNGGDLTGDPYTKWWTNWDGPGAWMERAYAYSTDEKNHTDALYVNDSWTIDSHWNALLGIRYNKMYMTSGGADIKSMSVLEPRGMIKYNPDGQNKHLFSVSLAKLSQAYSDEIANFFRGQEWSVGNITQWTGAALGSAQPGIDSPAAATDAPSGTYDGYTYTGQNMNGVRFVDYEALTNPANYGTRSGDIGNLVAQRQIQGLRSPYAIEWNLGYTRNYTNGWFRLNLVQRTYKDAILGHWYGGLTDIGANNWMVVPSPNPADPTYKQLNWKVYYPNATHDQIYRSVEFSFDRQLTTRWDLSGNFTYAVKTGVIDENEFTNHTLRNALIPASQQGNIAPDSILSNDKFGYVAVTYVQPVGKGNVSFCVKAAYSNNGGYTTPHTTLSYADLPGYSAYMSSIPTTLPNSAGGLIKWHSGYGDNGMPGTGPYYNVNTGDAGQYRDAWDTYYVDAKLNLDVPLYRKLHLIGYIEVHNLFNRMLVTSQRTAFSGGNQTAQQNWDGHWDAGVDGRMFQVFDANYVYGQRTNIKFPGQGYQDFNWGQGGRALTNFSIGLKF